MSLTATRKFLSKDQNWQDGQTTYWFEMEGEDFGTGEAFSGEVFGVVEGWSESTIVDSEGMPLEGGGYREIAVRKALDGAVTDELRADAVPEARLRAIEGDLNAYRNGFIQYDQEHVRNLQAERAEIIKSIEAAN